MSLELVDPRRSFVVVVHDVAPIHRDRLEAIVEVFRPRVGNKLVAAIIPCWHGRALEPGDGGLVRAFGEVLQHGTTHMQERPGWISWLSGGSNELDGLSIGAIVDRLGQGREILRRAMGVEAAGFVPPAWRMGQARRVDLAGLGFRYVAGFGSIWPVESAPIPLATWSWDWGIVPALGLAGEALAEARHRLKPGALPCVVVHPIDVDRGFLPRITRVVDRFLLEGRSPVTFSDLFPAVERESVA